MDKYHIGMMVCHKSYIPHGELLIESIRKNGGFYSDCPIFVLTPKHENIIWNIEEATQLEYEVPLELRKLPFADKMLAAAEFEKHVNCSYIWMDVDSIILQEPKEWDRLNKCEIGIKAVDKKNIGCLFDDLFTPFWKEIYLYYEVNTEVFPIFTSVSQEKIKPYFNAGMIVVKNHKDLFASVENGIKDLLKKPIIVEKIKSDILHNIFFHQAVLTVAVLAKYQNIYIMKDNINYPLHFRNQYPQFIDFKELETIRYDTYFEENTAPTELKNNISLNEKLLKMGWYYGE